MINDIMRKFETEYIEDESVARLLRGLDSNTLDLALDDSKYQRMSRFHDMVYNGEPIELSFEDEAASYREPCFSALSMGGHLIGARHRMTQAGEASPLDRHYALVTGSIHSDEIDEWRIVPWSRDERSGVLELTIDAPTVTPSLRLVPEWASDHGRALLEASRQVEEERIRQLTTRVTIGRQAWKLLKPGYVHEPLRGTYGLQQQVAYARLRGFTPQTSHEYDALPEVEVIDNYR